MGLAKAKIVIDGEDIDVMFNPTQYQLDANNRYEWRNVGGVGKEQFIGGDESLAMTLFFDTYEQDEDVRDYTSRITRVVELEHKSVGDPVPVCQFVWGSLNFTGRIESISQQFTMFSQSGFPVRATLSLTIRKTKGKPKEKEKGSASSRRNQKQRVLQGDEDLQSVAQQEYQDPERWRDIAEASGIDNPRRLQAGMVLNVPR
ncbi:peptidoglycan-binding protein [Brevibacillus humidisoli]|uniref:CIS tube protein n=1 Tax=Brevibacillus humidisoli TaxID=2895522 RepID=UPI001E411612|nr:peptidoglycan-binding protein [Brevibacillus humidisoli]UFJ38952.1 peptidoglycan-binding protein [Brevibacillus humidisoli]